MVHDCCVFNCPNRRATRIRMKKNSTKQEVYMDLDLDVDLVPDQGQDKQPCRTRSKSHLKVNESTDETELPSKIMTRYHKFPLKRLDMLEKWVKVTLPYTKPQQGEWLVSIHTTVCSEHFRLEDYKDANDPKKLYKQAVPSIFRVAKIAHTSDIVEQMVDGLPLWVRVVDQSIADPRHKGLKPQFTSRGVSVGSAYCRALGCGSYTENAELDALTFHRFPCDDPDLLEKWVKAVGISDFNPARHWALCSLHFSPDCYRITTNKLRVLKPSAVPTLFKLPGPELMHRVDLSSPYLQPHVVLRGLHDPEPLPKPIPQEEQEEEEEEPSEPVGVEEEDMDVLEPVERAVIGTMHDHKYMKTEDDDEKEIALFKSLLEKLKDQVMSTSQRVKSLKISVSALKYQYGLEQESLNSDGQIR